MRPCFLLTLLLFLLACGSDDDDNGPRICEEGLIPLEEYAAADTFTYTELGNTGLLYYIAEPGTGPLAAAGDSIAVAYQGAVTNNRLFDARPQNNPLRIRLDNLIEGWRLGIPLIAEGGIIRLLIPAELGYGSNGSCNPLGQCSICPDSDLIFNIQLIELVK